MRPLPRPSRASLAQILTQSDAEVLRWRTALLEALGLQGKLIVSLVPEIELIIGEQPPVADLPPQDAQNRFQMVFSVSSEYSAGRSARWHCSSTICNGWIQRRSTFSSTC